MAKTLNKLEAAIGCNCFVAGTMVQTVNGEKPIEEIQGGDKVLARNDEDEIYSIQVGNQIIETTYNHPFWVEGKGWTFAKDLELGDLLVQANGHTIRIDGIDVKSQQATVYNFTVADFHTYFVGELGIWVHNSSCSIHGNSHNTDKPAVGYTLRDRDTGETIKKVN